MITATIEICAKYRALVLLAGLAAGIGGVASMRHVELDAIPDLSDTQVIVFTEWAGRSPTLIEDQVTYPLVTALLSAPRVHEVRGQSMFGMSFVYVVFEEGTDVYWARSRVLELLSSAAERLPESARSRIGPDASGIGWVYQYALVDRSGNHDLGELRTLHDYSIRYALASVPGVAEIATVGGFEPQYQVSVDPARLRNYGISLEEIADAIRRSNSDVGGRLIEMSEREHFIRGRGYLTSVSDLETVVIRSAAEGAPVLVRDVATVRMGGEIRRGAADLNGEGEVVSGIVVMRHGENALSVIERVKEKLQEVSPSLPPGVEMITTYDRSDLIKRAIDTLKDELIVEMIIVSAVILLFLWHIPSAIVPIVTIPVSVILAFIPMYLMGVTSNIMSLAGIAISIGVLVDGAIVEVENAYRRLQEWQDGGRKGDFHEVRLNALKEVGPSVFFSLLVIAVAFLPIFTLVDQEGRLFKPLAYTKNLAMAIAAILAITLDPAMRMMFARMDPIRFRPRWLSWITHQIVVGNYHPEERHPVNRVLFRIYDPACRFVLRWPKSTIIAALLLVVSTIPVYLSLGAEFMPPLDEGDLVYMPITQPGISVTEAQRLLQTMDRLIKETPEVETVFGKAGRAESSTDPAPFSMVETTIRLKPPSEWRSRPRFYSDWPEWLRAPLRHIWYDRITRDDLIAELDGRLRFPGVANAWVQPIKNRIDMLSTGIRTPIGVKIFGSDLRVIEKIGAEIEASLRDVEGTRSIFAERTAGGFFLDFDLRRDQLARYGLSVEEAQMVIQAAIGGETITRTIEGRERYTVNVRYERDERDSLERLERVLVPTMSGAQVPLAQIADIRLSTGPSMIRDENGSLAGYVYVDIAGRDIGGYVEEAKKLVAEQVKIPTGYSIQWSGQYENMLRVRERLKIVVPITVFLIFVLLYMNTKSAVKAGIVMLAVPFSIIGAVWLLYLLGYHVSIAVWVGMIALMGLDAETGVFMLLYLDISYNDAVRQGKMRTKQDLQEAIVHGAVRRIRPKMMTVCAAMMGLMPILWSLGSGADMMKRVAAPMVGGLVTSFILELLVYPPIYEFWKWNFEMKAAKE